MYVPSEWSPIKHLWWRLFAKILNNFSQKNLYHTLRDKCPYSELFWSTFSRIWTEQSECGKMRTRITPNTDTFYAVIIAWQVFFLLMDTNKNNLGINTSVFFSIQADSKLHKRLWSWRAYLLAYLFQCSCWQQCVRRNFFSEFWALLFS